MTPTTAEKRARFAALHAAPGCFVMPNPWDVGSAKFLSSLGFNALASTSAGMAFAAGRPDNAVTRAYALKHIGELAAATDLPLNADFEAGFGRDPDGVYESARLVIGAGVAGFSIEDYTGDPKSPFYSLREAVARLRAARTAINESGERVLLTARSECVWVPGGGGLTEALRRLAAFAEAGADVLFAPGVRTREDVAAVVHVAGKLPVNIVVGAPGLSREEFEDLGVKRISTDALDSEVLKFLAAEFRRADDDIDWQLASDVNDRRHVLARAHPRREKDIGAGFGESREPTQSLGEAAAAGNPHAFAARGQQHAFAAFVDCRSGGSEPRDGFSQRIERGLGVAGIVLDREAGDTGADDQPRALVHAVGVAAEAGFEIGVERQVGRRRELADVLEGVGASHGVVGPPCREGHAGAGRGERIETEGRKEFRRTDVPRIGHHETSGRGVQGSKTRALSAVVGVIGVSQSLQIEMQA